MTERIVPATWLSRRFFLVLLHLAEEARRDLDGIKARPARSIHSLRTRMKNLRAISGLVKARVSKHQRKAIAALAGALKDGFSEQRDSHVVAQLRARLEGRQRVAPESEGRARVNIGCESARTDSARLVRLISKLALKDLSWTDVIDRYVECYRDGRKAMKACVRNPSVASFHQWRRPVKDLFYQSQVLQPLTGMKARRMRADRLADRLGELHDLAVFRATLKKSHSRGLRKRIATKQKALKAAVLKAARKLFAERPREISVELARCVKFHPAIVAQSVRQT